MRVELTIDDLHLIKQALDTITIQGKDAPVVAKLLLKVEKSFKKEVEKQNG